jgi:uncharacterized membrane protein
MAISAFCCFQSFFIDTNVNLSQKDDLLKQNVLKILENKCNFCHRRQNPLKAFAYENIDKLAPKIYKQVYVKKRMPKGNPSLINKEEWDTLPKWLSSEGVTQP